MPQVLQERHLLKYLKRESRSMQKSIILYIQQYFDATVQWVVLHLFRFINFIFLQKKFATPKLHNAAKCGKSKQQHNYGTLVAQRRNSPRTRWTHTLNTLTHRQRSSRRQRWTLASRNRFANFHKVSGCWALRTCADLNVGVNRILESKYQGKKKKNIRKTIQ